MTSRALRERTSNTRSSNGASPAAAAVSDHAPPNDVGSALPETPETPETFVPNQPEAASERDFPAQHQEEAEPEQVAQVAQAAEGAQGAEVTEVAPVTDVTDQAPEAVTAQPGSRPLSERDRAMLTFEKQYWKYSGAKEQAIRDRFEMSATRYYQVLNALLDRPEAQEFEPTLVKRLRRQRAARQRARSGRLRPASPATR